MSDILQKSVYSLQKMIKNFNSTNLSITDVLPQFYNRKLEDFFKDMKSLSTNDDQDRLICDTLTYVKKVFAQPAPDKDEIGYCLILCKYCADCNFDTSFAAIQTIKLIEHGNKRHKKLGYTAVSWFLKPKDELLLLLINTIQKDILSNDIEEICLGMKAVTSIFNQDDLTSLLPRIEDRLIHSNETVRNKALVAIHHFILHSKQLSSSDRLLSKLIKCLGDKSLNVVISAVIVLHTLAEKGYGSKFILAIPSFLKIFEMLITHRVPMQFETKNLAAPHLQIKLSQLLVMLVKLEPSHSQQVVEFFKEAIQKTQANNLYAFAIIYECILGIIKLDSTTQHFDLIQDVVSNLLNSDEANLKFMGLECLVEAAKSSKHLIVLEFQPLIMQCLTHEDEHLKSKTISLLIAIANPVNYNAVFTKIGELLNTMQSPMYKQDTINMLFSLIPKLPLQSLFLINFINKDLYTHNSMISSDFINIVIRHLKKETSTENKTAVLLAYHDLLNKNEPVCQTLSFICISSWVFGEWWFEDVSINSLEIQRCLIKLLKLCDFILGQQPLLWIMSALRKLCTQSGVYPPELPECLSKCAEGFRPYKAVSLKINEMLKILENLSEIYKIFKDVEKIEFDPTFSCLDSYVYKCLTENSAEHYQPKPPAKAEEHLKLMNQINPPPSVASAAFDNSTSFMSMDSLKDLVSLEASSLSSTSEEPAAPRVWTLEGREETSSVISDFDTSLESSIHAEEETKKNNSLFLGLVQDKQVPATSPALKTSESQEDSIPPIYFEADT